MVFDWKDFFILARFLDEQAGNFPNGEAFLRSAVSRAYYGPFCFVRNHASKKLGFVPRGEAADHGALRKRIRIGKLKAVSDRLDRLRMWRNECDYQDQLAFNLKEAVAEALDHADFIFAQLGSSPSGGK